MYSNIRRKFRGYAFRPSVYSSKTYGQSDRLSWRVRRFSQGPAAGLNSTGREWRPRRGDSSYPRRRRQRYPRASMQRGWYNEDGGQINFSEQQHYRHPPRRRGGRKVRRPNCDCIYPCDPNNPNCKPRTRNNYECAPKHEKDAEDQFHKECEERLHALGRQRPLKSEKSSQSNVPFVPDGEFNHYSGNTDTFLQQLNADGLFNDVHSKPPRNDDNNHYVERKQAGNRSKRNKRRKFDQKIKREYNQTFDEMGWNQDRRNYDGATYVKRWRPRGHFYNQDIQWSPKAGYETHEVVHEAPYFDDEIDKRILIPYQLNDDEVKEFETICGKGYRFGHDVHDHALCAAVRWACQRELESRFTDKYVDLFGSARLKNDRKWTHMPVLTTHDEIRRRPERKCDCVDLTQCTHLRCCDCANPIQCPHFDNTWEGFIVDTVYYMTYEDLFALCSKLKNGRLYTLHHSFRGVFAANLQKTYNWFNDGQNVHVICGRGENKHTYKHLNLDWLRQGTMLCDNGVLTYELITTRGPMEIGVFSIRGLQPAQQVDNVTTKVTLPGVELPKADCYLDQRYFYAAKKFMQGKGLDTPTEKDLNSFLKRLNMEDKPDQPYRTIEAVFPELWFKHQQDVITCAMLYRPEMKLAVDRTLQAKGALIELMQQSETKYQEEIRFFSFKRIGRTLNSLNKTLTQSVSHGIDREVNTMGTMATKAASAMVIRGVHSGFEALIVRNMHSFFGNTFRCDICIVTDHGINPRDYHLRDGTTEILPRGISQFIDRIPWKTRHSQNDFIPSECVLKFDNECGCKHPDNRRRGGLMLAWLSGFEPYTFAGCENNIQLALRMRFMRTLSPINPYAWQALEEHIKLIISCIKSRQKMIPQVDLFDKWVRKFPQTKQALMRKCLAEPEEPHYGTFAASVCCKWEVGIAIEGENKPFKPRAFFPKTPHNLCRNGPNMDYIKTHISRLFDGRETPFIFGPGNNNLQLGSKFSNAIRRRACNDDWMSVELDLSMCETTMRGPHLVVEGDVYRKLGLSSDDVDFLLTHKTSYGTSTKRNLKFSMPFCRESGTANTTPGNTVVFAVELWAALTYCGVTENDFVALIGGDDSALYFHKSLIHRVRCAISIVTDLGLKPEAIEHPTINGARFFSGRMIQCRRVGHPTLVYVHMPLIGRCVAKNMTCKWQGQKLGPWLRDVSIARFYEWEHIPILREINVNVRAAFSGYIGDCRIEMPYRAIDASKTRLVYCDTTFNQLATVYGLEVDDINKCCAHMNQHFSGNWIGKPIDDEVLEIMARIDLA